MKFIKYFILISLIVATNIISIRFSEFKEKQFVTYKNEIAVQQFTNDESYQTLTVVQAELDFILLVNRALTLLFSFVVLTIIVKLVFKDIGYREKLT
jgi:hypothetical protein